MPKGMPSPESLLIKSIHWDFFTTFTHAPLLTSSAAYKQGSSLKFYELGEWWDQPTFDEQMARLGRWHNRCWRRLKMRENEFCTATRWEVGRGGREHFHCLVRILDPTKRTKSVMYFLKHVWAQGFGFGHAQVRRSNVMSNDYITKILSEYEESRFEDMRQRSVFFNKPCLRYLAKLRS